MAEQVVQARNLRKIYGKKPWFPGLLHRDLRQGADSPGHAAVEDVSVEVARGEIFGLLGPNGAGKTTTILMLNTLTRPTAGWARVCGHDVVKDPDRVRESIGYVAQDTVIDGNLTASENMSMIAAFYGIRPRDASRRVDELLELADLSDRRKALVKTFSGGMKRKLELLGAIVHAPKVLFLDEPTLGLDPASRALLWEQIRLMARTQHVSVFLTSHYLEEVDALCDRIAILNGGRIQITGSPHDLKRELMREQIVLQTGSRSDEEKLRAVLGTLAFVEKVDDSQGSLRLTVDDAERRLSDLVCACHSGGVRLETVGYRKATLDDVFFRYGGKRIE